MKIGIGLPNPVPAVPGSRLTAWARRAEERGFSGLVTIDRIAYPSHDSLVSLAAAAGATSRIGLMTNILLAPLYQPVILARVAATIDQVSDGRFTLGLAPGGRPDDYAVLERDLHTRGRDFDRQLELLHAAWRGDHLAGTDKPTGPTPVHDRRVPILFGGTSDAALRRVTTWGDGWTAGGAPAEQVAGFVGRVRDAWREAGRSGEPRLSALAYFSVGDDAEAESRRYLQDYYAFTGPYAERIADGARRSDTEIRETVKAFEDLGMSELYFDPTAAGLDQVDRLADLVL